MVNLLKAISWYQHTEGNHPLTCGKTSTHKPLIADLNNRGQVIGLKCEECDYVQKYVPDVIIHMYKKYKEKGWLANHKNEIIYDLKNMISDVNDEHYGSFMFFKLVRERVDKWEKLKESDEYDD